MYIWILLATIMVALSFFNISPRADKENTVNEVKASLIVNRFRAEHLAMARTLECEVIRRSDNSDWRETFPVSFKKEADGSGSATIKFTSPRDSYPVTWDLPYTQYKCNLPMGYELDSPLLEVRHAIICTDKRLEDPDQTDNVAVQCQRLGHGRYQYIVSYAKIPDRWITKETVKYDDEFDVARPLPALANLLAKATSYGSVYGWTDCAERNVGGSPKVECDLRGYNARVLRIQEQEADEDEENGAEPQKVDPDRKVLGYTVINKSAPVWNIPDFADMCNSTIPCLFAYERFPTSDNAYHCYNLMEKFPKPNCE